MNNRYEETLKIKKTIKRYLITLLCCLPLLIVVGVLLEGKVNTFVRMTIFVVILAVVYIVVELITKRKTKNKHIKVEHEDVFK